jgi:hypothetical protein
VKKLNKTKLQLRKYYIPKIGNSWPIKFSAEHLKIGVIEIILIPGS